MKVRRIYLNLIKDFLRSLPPNVSIPCGGMDEA